VPRTTRPRLYLHIGEPKTGTTFVQEAIWENRARLASQGVLLPGYSVEDHFRASRDLRGAQRMPSDPAPRWEGDWDVLIRQALLAPEAALISNELLVACRPNQADRAVRSLDSAEVHIIVTLRDIAHVLPAEWQEAVKWRNTVTWEDWLDEVVRTAPVADRRRESWFWTMHGTLANLAMWSRHIPPDFVHVITLPQHGPSDALWARFASVIGIEPGSVDLPRERLNASLGLVEAEFLRRLNGALPAEIPEWFYTRDIRRVLVPDALRTRPDQARLVLPPAVEAWAREQSEVLVEGLRDSKYHIVGDLTDLLSEPGTSSYVSPAELPAYQLLDAAVQVASALVHRNYRDRYAADPQEQGSRGLRQRISGLEWAVLNGPLTRRRLRNASQFAAIRRLRVTIWRVLMHPRRQRRADRPGGTLRPSIGRPALPGSHPNGRRSITIKLPSPRRSSPAEEISSEVVSQDDHS